MRKLLHRQHEELAVVVQEQKQQLEDLSRENKDLKFRILSTSRYHFTYCHSAFNDKRATS